jgi:hypothetical protein
VCKLAACMPVTSLHNKEIFDVFDSVVFRRVRKIAKIILFLSVCSSVWNNCAPTGWILMKLRAVKNLTPLVQPVADGSSIWRCHRTHIKLNGRISVIQFLKVPGTGFFREASMIQLAFILRRNLCYIFM